jgi:hypothetical protein
MLIEIRHGFTASFVLVDRGQNALGKVQRNKQGNGCRLLLKGVGRIREEYYEVLNAHRHTSQKTHSLFNLISHPPADFVYLEKINF